MHLTLPEKYESYMRISGLIHLFKPPQQQAPKQQQGVSSLWLKLLFSRQNQAFRNARRPALFRPLVCSLLL